MSAKVLFWIGLPLIILNVLAAILAAKVGLWSLVLLNIFFLAINIWACRVNYRIWRDGKREVRP